MAAATAAPMPSLAVILANGRRRRASVSLIRSERATLHSALFVITSGDPIRRPDLADHVHDARSGGLTSGLTPGGTAAATKTRLRKLPPPGLSRIAVSLDGPTPQTERRSRRAHGSIAWTMRITESAIELALSPQVNSTISRLTLPYLKPKAQGVNGPPVKRGAPGFLVQTGRHAGLDQISVACCEHVLTFLYDRSLIAPSGIKTTQAPQREQKQAMRGFPSSATGVDITPVHHAL